MNFSQRQKTEILPYTYNSILVLYSLEIEKVAHDKMGMAQDIDQLSRCMHLCSEFSIGEKLFPFRQRERMAVLVLLA